MQKDAILQDVDDDLMAEMMEIFIDAVQKALKKMPPEKREAINKIMDKKIKKLMEG